MKKIKVSEAKGAALDWMVAKCEGHNPICFPFTPDGDFTKFKPSTDWSQGGPIIEREQITIGADGEGWCAGKPWDQEWMSSFVQRGTTPLIAAMRCYVASKLGDDVEVPNALCLTY